MDTAAEKAAQRKAGIAARRALSEADRAAANAALCRRIAQLRCFREAQTLLAYAAFGGEADLSALLAEAERLGKTVSYPVCGEGFTLTAAVPEPDGWEAGGLRHPHPHPYKIAAACAGGTRPRARALHRIRRRVPPRRDGERLL